MKNEANKQEPSEKIKIKENSQADFLTKQATKKEEVKMIEVKQERVEPSNEQLAPIPVDLGVIELD